MKRMIIKILITSILIFNFTIFTVLAVTYNYDSLGRLTSASYNSGLTRIYQYDSVGNILSFSSSTNLKQITSYSILYQTEPSIIDNTNHTITAYVPTGTNLTNLVATFTLSNNTSAQVGNVPQVSGITPNDFTNPVTYRLTALDNSEQDWIVSVILK